MHLRSRTGAAARLEHLPLRRYTLKQQSPEQCAWGYRGGSDSSVCESLEMGKAQEDWEIPGRVWGQVQDPLTWGGE